MKKISLTFVLTLFAFAAFSQTWVSDPAHSRLAFTISHLTISEVTGNFKQFSVKVMATKPDHSDAQVELTAQIASINTDVEQRDTHLKSPDFFDTQTFPTLNFKSTSIKKVKGNDYKLIGNLTMHGITKAVTLNVTFKGSVTNPMSKQLTSGFIVKGTLKRSDFNIGGKFPAAMVGDQVSIWASIEFSESK